MTTARELRVAFVLRVYEVRPSSPSTRSRVIWSTRSRSARRLGEHVRIAVRIDDLDRASAAVTEAGARPMRKRSRRRGETATGAS